MADIHAINIIVIDVICVLHRVAFNPNCMRSVDMCSIFIDLIKADILCLCIIKIFSCSTQLSMKPAHEH